MPTYQYKARDEEGRLISGRMDVSGEQELQDRLESSGFFLVKFNQERKDVMNEDIMKKFMPVTDQDLYALTVQLANTVSTGLPLLISLRSIADGCRNKKLVGVLESIIEDLKSGSSFSEALKRSPKVFSKFFTSMVELGETSGTLPKVLLNLSDYIKKEMEIKRKVMSAMAYPMVLVVVATGLVSYLLIHVMPQFVSIYSEEGLTLPLMTRLLIGFSAAFASHWYIIVIAVIGLVVGFRLFVRNEFGRAFVDKTILNLPLVGKVIKVHCTKRFVDGLYLLYSSGLPILKALHIVKSIIHNRYLENIVEALWVHIAAGRDLTSYLSLTDFFRPDILAMIRSGEEGGTLQNMLQKISEIYYDEVNHSVEFLISSFEIAVILSMGIGVGFVAIALIFPIIMLGRGLMAQ